MLEFVPFTPMLPHRANSKKSLSAAHEANSVAASQTGLNIGSFIAKPEVHEPRVTQIASIRRRRPEQNPWRTRKNRGVDSGVGTRQLDNAVQFLDIGQSPVAMSRETETINELQRTLPVAPLSTVSTARAIPVLSYRTAHPRQPGFVMRGGAVVMQGEILGWRRWHNVAAAGLRLKRLRKG